MALTEKLTVYDNTLGQVLRFLHPLNGARPPGGDKRFSQFDAVPIRYVVQLSPEAYKVLQGNPLLKQKIQLDMIGIGQNLVRTRIDPMLRPTTQVTPQLARRLEAIVKEGEREVNALVDTVLRRHAEMNKAWGDYYKSMRKDMIFIAVGFALTATSIALAVPTGGASLALTIAGGAKSVAEAVKKVGEAWRTAEEQQARLHRSITVLLNAYIRSVHQGRAMQISGALLDTIGVLPVIEMLPFVRQQLMPSISKIQGDMATYKGKLGSLYEASNKLAAQLFGLLDDIEAFKAANPGTPMPKIEKMEKKIAALLDSGVRMARFRSRLTVSGAYSRYEIGMVELEKLNQLITQLNGIEKHPRAVTILCSCIKVFGSMALAAGGQAAGAGFGSAKEIGSFTVGLSGDVISTINDLVDLSETVKGDAPPSQVQTIAQQFNATHDAVPVPPPPHIAPSGGTLVSRPPTRRPPPPPPPPGRRPVPSGTP
jgi:hypothetical protein